MKIWLLTSEFPPLYGGGISTYCIESVNMFSFYGHEVTIITPDPKIKKIAVKDESNYKIVRFNPNEYYTASFLGYETHLSYSFSQVVKEMIQRYGAPDIIEAQEYMGIAYYLLHYKWLRYPLYKDLKIVITLHAPSFLYFEYNQVSLYENPHFWVGEMERFCIRAADMVLSPSKYLVKELSERMILEDIKIHIVRNPYEVKRKFQIQKIEKNKLVFFGKLTPQKGCLKLIEDFKHLWDTGFTYPLYMIGGGNHLYHPERRDMNDFIKKKYKKQIKNGLLHLLGSIAPEKISSHLENAHAILVPSIVDNLPYTVLEAMGNSKVVLASKQGGQSEIISDQHNGFLFDHQVSDSFKNKLTEVLSLTENQIESIANAAYNTVCNEYSYKIVYDIKIKLLDQLLGCENSRSRFPLTHPFFKEPVPLSKSDLNGAVSVIIPYYNMGQYLKGAIASIRSSTYKNIEIIIVNDGSTDKQSIDVLNAFRQNSQIVIVDKENEGLALARNVGAQKATGQYIAILDPDDTIEPTYYEKAIAILSHYDNVHFVGCWSKYFGNSEGYWAAFNPEPPFLLIHNMINSSALIFKKNAFLVSGMNDKKMIYGMEDYESVINLVKNGYSGVVLPEPLWNYRIRENSMARLFTKEKQIYLFRLIADKHRDFYAIFASQIVNLLNANGPGMYSDNPTIINKFSSNKWINLKFKHYLIKIVKSNPFIRKMAIQIINFIKHK
jgi:glycosyltransferase involved in cell wall biosynthesis